jgi:PAS domain S-box-containing protein
MTLTRVEAVASANAVRLPSVALPARFAAEPLALQRLERANDLLGAGFDAMTTPVAVLDMNGRMLLVNAAWRELARLSDGAIEREVIGAEYLDVGIPGAITPRQALALRANLRKVLRRSVQCFELPIRIKYAGSDRWYEVRATRVEKGGPVRIVVSHRDITAHRAAEEAVKALSRRLLTLQEEERQRIAVELHDSTCQQLTAAGLHLLALRRTSQQTPLALAAIDQVELMISEAQKEIRSLSYLLHPPYLHRDGLRTTLTSFVAGYRQRTGLRAAAQIPDEVDNLSPAAQLALLRIAQEALSNVYRHASATQVLVKMRTTRTSLLFDICDDGIGMSHPPDHADKQRKGQFGLGVPGMRARVRELGGALRIRSGTRGTRISGKVPLSRCEAWTEGKTRLTDLAAAPISGCR